MSTEAEPLETPCPGELAGQKHIDRGHHGLQGIRLHQNYGHAGRELPRASRTMWADLILDGDHRGEGAEGVVGVVVEGAAEDVEGAAVQRDAGVGDERAAEAQEGSGILRRGRNR